MFPYPLHADAILRSLLQYTLDKVCRLVTHLVGYDIFASLYQLKRAGKVTTIERKISSEQRVQDDTATPDVCFVATISSTVYDFRSGIMRASAGRVEPVADWLKRRHTEIGELDVVTGVQQDVLWLQVPMAYVKSMTIAKSGNYLTKQPDSFFFWERAFLGDIVEEFSAVDVF